MPHKDPAARAAYARAWKAANRERARELSKASYERHREATLEGRKDRLAHLDAPTQAAIRERARRYAATYRERHRDDIRDRAREQATQQPERARQYAATYRQRHREAINERKRDTYAADPEGERRRRRMATAAARVARGLTPFVIRLTPDERKARRSDSWTRWRAAHLLQARENERRWRARNPEYRRLYATLNATRMQRRMRAWHEANRDRRRQQQRQRYQANPLKYRAWAMDYVARKRRAECGPVDHAAIVIRDRGECQICYEPVAERDRSFDHIIPLSLGGPHVQWNLRLTHFRCNARRGAGRIPAQIYLPL